MTQNLPATPMDDDFTGLEDFGLEDAVIPRLKIIHKEGMFEDNLSGGKYPKIRLIILGMVKQRILWHHELGDNEKPMCRSADFKIGFPTLKDVQRGKEFPWEKADLNPDDFPPDEDGMVALPCASCNLKEWGTHPNGRTPYCAEQWTLAVLYDGFDTETQSWSDTWAIALLSLQKSALKSVRAYLTSFTRARQAAYTAICEVSLTVKTRGQVDYSTPNFRGIGKTDPDKWPEYMMQAKQMRDYLKRAPEPVDDGEENAPSYSDNSYNQPPSSQQAPEQAAASHDPTPNPTPSPSQPAQPQQPRQPDPAPAPGGSDLPF